MVSEASIGELIVRHTTKSSRYQGRQLQFEVQGGRRTDGDQRRRDRPSVSGSANYSRPSETRSKPERFNRRLSVQD